MKAFARHIDETLWPYESPPRIELLNTATRLSGASLVNLPTDNLSYLAKHTNAVHFCLVT